MKILKDPLIYYRLAKWLNLKHIPILPKLIMYWIRFFYAAFIPYTADIGNGTKVGYGGLGIVIHEKSVIGSGCLISQHVTIGGNHKEDGVPTIGNNVYIGAGAKIIGPLHIHDNAIIGANAVVISDVYENQVVGGVPSKVLNNQL